MMFAVNEFLYPILLIWKYCCCSLEPNWLDMEEGNNTHESIVIVLYRCCNGS